MAKRFLVVAYDICDDRRRAKLHKALLDYGTAVQYSVFECLLDAPGVAKMKRAVNRLVKRRVDNVRYYSLCAACQGKVQTTQNRETTKEETAIVV